MSVAESESKLPSRIQNWLITFSIMLFSFFGFTLPLICIYSLPDKSVRPMIGSVFYMCGSIVLIFMLLLRWKKDIAIAKTGSSTNNQALQKFLLNESISDKILKWFVAICVLSFVFDGLCIALICIYALPDKTTQPIAGLLYFLSGSLPLGSFVFVVWKNWTTTNRP